MTAYLQCYSCYGLWLGLHVLCNLQACLLPLSPLSPAPPGHRVQMFANFRREWACWCGFFYNACQGWGCRPKPWAPKGQLFSAYKHENPAPTLGFVAVLWSCRMPGSGPQQSSAGFRKRNIPVPGRRNRFKGVRVCVCSSPRQPTRGYTSITCVAHHVYNAEHRITSCKVLRPQRHDPCSGFGFARRPFVQRAETPAMGVEGEHLCRRFAKIHPSEYPILSAEVVKELDLQVLQDASESVQGMTWLQSKEDESGTFCIGCSVCAEMLAIGDRDIVANFGIRHLTGLKPKRLKQHQQSAAHVAAVMRLLKPDEKVGQPLVRENTAPAAADFEAILAHVRKGGSLRQGIPGIAHFAKAKCMMFLLAESTKRLYRSWIRSSTTINLLRDERHARLLVRFRCADYRGVRGIGVLGQARVVQGTATNVAEATMAVFKEFCTTNHGAPELQDAGKIQFDATLFQHLRETVHSLTVDAAGNEIAAGECMRSTKSVTATNGEACTPNLHTIIRDKAHASRRILERPWACDCYLSFLGSSFLSASSSLAQLLEHSSDYRAWYQEFRSCQKHVYLLCIGST